MPVCFIIIVYLFITALVQWCCHEVRRFSA